MSNKQLQIFRQWVQTLPEQDITLENAIRRQADGKINRWERSLVKLE